MNLVHSSYTDANLKGTLHYKLSRTVRIETQKNVISRDVDSYIIMKWSVIWTIVSEINGPDGLPLLNKLCAMERSRTHVYMDPNIGHLSLYGPTIHDLWMQHRSIVLRVWVMTIDQQLDLHERSAASWFSCFSIWPVHARNGQNQAC